MKTTTCNHYPVQFSKHKFIYFNTKMLKFSTIEPSYDKVIKINLTDILLERNSTSRPDT